MKIRLTVTTEKSLRVLEGEVNSVAKMLIGNYGPVSVYNGSNHIKIDSIVIPDDIYLKGKKEYRDALFQSLCTLIEKEVIENGLIQDNI